jgi:small subunit ribosomal protein S17
MSEQAMDTPSTANLSQGDTSTPEGKVSAPAQTSQRNRRKTREGYVVSDKMQKTIVVELEDRKQHALYGKIMRSTTKVKAHDEVETAGIGDRVLLMETRPLSKDKRWRLVRVVEKAK